MRNRYLAKVLIANKFVADLSEYEKYMTTTPCETCHGKRLKKEALAVTVGDKNIADLCHIHIITRFYFFGHYTTFMTLYQVLQKIS